MMVAAYMVALLTMVAGRYGISLVFNSVSDSFAVFTCEISSGTLDEKFYVTACPSVVSQCRHLMWIATF